MGGGGGMKAAAKVVGFTVATGGIRGVTAAENYPVSFATRKVASSFPVSAGVSVAEDVKLMVSQSQADVQKPCWELDDWEFAGREDDLMVSPGDPMPRVVFGGPPTLQEAKEATSELTEAVEKAYLSSPHSAGYGGSLIADHGSSSSLSNTKVVETRRSSEKFVAPAVPTHAIQAFKFLNDSSAAQNVVASIACDPNVWNAVLQNQELQEFLQSQKSCLAFSDMNLHVKESVADNDLFDHSSQESDDMPSDSGHSGSGNGFLDIMQKIKLAVDMMSGLSDFFQNFFRGKEANKISVNDDGTARLNGVETVLEASFMGLAIMAIMVILLKRG
ncbi:hypothetical protein Fot_45102 [Forsythia ovata]|uniref:Uncharacterized protein n=1 Tax=Forsythia ovata TaxID=205694 RepID=A0ABD1R5J4_9LAMI